MTTFPAAAYDVAGHRADVIRWLQGGRSEAESYARLTGQPYRTLNSAALAAVQRLRCAPELVINERTVA